MASDLGEKLTATGLPPLFPVDANLVFVALPRALDAKLKAAGANYYARPSETVHLPPDHVMARLVASFATSQEDVERFVNLCKNF
jgi:threonine aldolase